MFTLVGPYFDWIQGTVLHYDSKLLILVACCAGLVYLNFKMVYWSFGQSNMHCTLNVCPDKQGRDQIYLN